MGDEKVSWTEEEIMNVLYQFPANKQIIILLLLDIRKQNVEIIDQLSMLNAKSCQQDRKK